MKSAASTIFRRAAHWRERIQTAVPPPGRPGLSVAQTETLSPRLAHSQPCQPSPHSSSLSLKLTPRGAPRAARLSCALLAPLRTMSSRPAHAVSRVRACFLWRAELRSALCFYRLRLSKDTWVASRFWLFSSASPLRTWIYKYLFVSLPWIFFSCLRRTGIVGHTTLLCSTF